MRILFTLLLSFWSTAATALCVGDSFMDRLSAEERDQVAQAVDATPYPTGLHWTATKGNKTLRLIGTMHLADPRLDAVFAQTASSLQTSELLLVEATQEDEAKLQSLFAETPELIFITEGPTLPERVDAETWDAISEAVSARMVPPFLASKMQPWYLSLTLSIPPCLVTELATGARGLDHMLMEFANELGVPVAALEDPTALIEALSAGTFDEQLDALKLSLLAPDLQSEMFVAMLNAYFDEEIAEIWEASRLAANYVPGLDPELAADLFAEAEQTLLIQRNLDWIPVINDAFSQHDVITFAAGAAHLPGEFGVLKLLETEGWSITRNVP